MAIEITRRRCHELLRLHAAYANATAEDRGFIAAEAVRKLGALSPWWLTADALERAQAAVAGLVPDHYLQFAKQPPSRAGVSFLLFVWLDDPDPEPGENTLLRPAPVLPVRWRTGVDDAPTLPPNVRALAERVRRLLQGDGYGLDWPEFVPGIDASTLDCAADSAFITLAAGLLLAKRSAQAVPDPSIWCTGQWDETDNEVEPVDGVEEKVRTCLQFGARRIFVPAANAIAARRTLRQCGYDPGIVEALPVVTELDRVLGPVMTRFRLEPQEGAPAEELADYYNYLAERGARAECADFYARRLCEHAAQHCRQNLPPSLSGLPEQEPVLVVTVSPAVELIRLAYLVFRPRRIFAVELAGDVRPTGRARENLQKWIAAGMPVERVPYEGDDPDQAVSWARSLYDRILRDFPDVPVVVDHTPGPKLVSIGLLLGTPPGIYHAYLKNRWTKSRVPEFPPEGYCDLTPCLYSQP